MRTKYIIIAIVSLICLHIKAEAKAGSVRFGDVSIEKIDDEVVVGFEVTIIDFSSDDRLHITPVIFNGEGKWQRLETLVLVGKRRNIYDLRTGAKQDLVKVVKKPNKNKNINYQARIPYEDWMRYISVCIDETWEGCCANVSNFADVTSDSVLLLYDLKPFYDISPLSYNEKIISDETLDTGLFSAKQDEYSNIRYKAANSSELAVGFKLGSTIIELDYANNNNILDSLINKLKTVDSDPFVCLRSVIISGYASPEGSLYRNEQLARKRAEAVKNYILKYVNGIDDTLFEIRNGSEDWKGLREKVESSGFEYKDEILQIIDSHKADLGIRKKKLQEFKGGIPYNYMLRNFYPSLRCGGFMQINYEIDRIGRINSLSQTADRNWIKAVEYMMDNKFDSALEILLPLKEWPTVWNNIGVCYMMKGMYDQADVYFLKASDNGDADAQKNIEQTKWARKVK